MTVEVRPSVHLALGRERRDAAPVDSAGAIARRSRPDRPSRQASIANVGLGGPRVGQGAVGAFPGEGCPRTPLEPGGQRSGEAARSGDLDAAGVDRLGSALVPLEDVRERGGGGGGHDVGGEAGVLQAHRRLAVVEDDPDRLRFGGGVAELDDGALRREPGRVDPAVHPPHECGHGHVVRAQVVEEPLDGPTAQTVDDALEITSLLE